MTAFGVAVADHHCGDAELLEGYAKRLLAIGEELMISADHFQQQVGNQLGKLAESEKNSAVVRCIEQLVESGVFPVSVKVSEFIKEAGSDLGTFAHDLKSIQ